MHWMFPPYIVKSIPDPAADGLSLTPTCPFNRSTDNTSEILRKNWILSISVTPCLLNQD